MNWDKVIENIRTELKRYILDNHLSSLVLGVSGGIDSCLCAALAYPVCRDLGVPLIGLSITIETNKLDEFQRSILVGKAFCDDFEHIDLTAEYKAKVQRMSNHSIHTDYSIHNDNHLLADTLSAKIRRGNIKARMRMIELYDVAQARCGLVLSTDNWTELQLGFFTLCGDVGDLGMIQNLTKTEVYEVSRYLIENEFKKDNEREALESCVIATPTDGLGVTNSDLEQIGADSYEEVDNILKSYIQKEEEYFKTHPVIVRHNKTHYKRKWPYNFSKEILFEGCH